MRPLVILCVLASVAHAQDPYEIQVYDSEVALRGEIGVELHLNHHLIDGAPNVTNTTFEPHYGFNGWLELGGYLQSSTIRGSRPQFAGVKLRAKARLPHRLWGDRIGLAVNGELSIVPSEFDPAVWGVEIRPIADIRIDRFYASVNPILSVPIGGDLAGHPAFEPAVKAEYWILDWLGAGAEGYGGFGPIDDLGSESVMSLFGVIDLHSRSFDLNVGLGATRDSPDHPIAKLIFGMHP
jgi:hypothetical protein